ncbi:MAG: hypothetical protein V7603_2831 [Micromonosporaceae bacterium]
MTPVQSEHLSPPVPDDVSAQRRWPRRLTAVLAVLLVVGGAALILTHRHPAASLRPLPGRSADTLAPHSSVAGREPAIATNAGPFDAGPVSPPAVGALVGAWVRPPSLSQPGRVAAVRDLERTLGRRLDIVHTYRRFEDPFPTKSDRAYVADGAILMLSWVIDDTRVISSGVLDPRLRDWARRLRDLSGPVMLRLRWEMDRPNLSAAMWSGKDYVAAWRHVRTIFTQEQVDNVSWVWCPTAEGFAGGYAPAFYPGDADVDWVCVDVYANTRLQPLGDLLRPFLTWAAAHPRPIVIGEFAVAQTYGAAAQSAWIDDAALLVRANPQIKAVCYFDADPEGNGHTVRYELSGEPLAAFARLARGAYFNPFGR